MMNKTQANLISGIVKRDGTVQPFDATKIVGAVLRALKYDADGVARPAGDSASNREKAEQISQRVVAALARIGQATVHIEAVQDQVELALMREGDHVVARDYVLFRERRAQSRARPAAGLATVGVKVQFPEGERIISAGDIESELLEKAGTHLGTADAALVATAVMRDIFDGINSRDYDRALVLGSRQYIERDPKFAKASAALMLASLRREANVAVGVQPGASYAEYFPAYLKRAAALGLISSELLQFDVSALAQSLDAARDFQFDLLGIMTLADRYFLTDRSGALPARIELPQAFFMRVAMGLALRETEREARAVEFYGVLSRFEFMTSTPTLFNAGTNRPQLSSCFLTTIPDDLDGIFSSIKDNALLSKFAGGLGNDWTPVRAMGSLIQGTNGESQGVVPFLKVVNDTAVAVNQGGKRKGAVAAYLETWHLDIEEFLDLRKNTGDDRRRTHDMNTANWIPDLFMKRVKANASWTLFSPVDVPDLHDLYGAAFEARYEQYEALAALGKVRSAKTVQAVSLWRKMLSMLYETGHPWITFKDPCNVRSPQRHAGVVHSSNLCTEITLNTSDDEIAVCNLGSVNLVAHMAGQGDRSTLDLEHLRRTTRTAMRMLDNAIDINYYTVPKARNSNLRHRPVGLGLMGLHDALQMSGVSYASEEAVGFSGRVSEALCFYAYSASCELAAERGRYPSYSGSDWSQGILPQDTVARLAAERQLPVPVEVVERMPWTELRQAIAMHGMRNSNCMAIAPTATIANIVGVSAGADPNYQNLFVKSNLGGEFTVINARLVAELKEVGLWDELMIADLKHYDGSLEKIERVPQSIRKLYATSFEIDPEWTVKAAAERQIWIDQAQSTNIYMAHPSGSRLGRLYEQAWERGLKTTYYLRTLSATSAEKSTGRGGELNAVRGQVPVSPAAEPLPAKLCSIDNPDCEACQ